MATKRIKVRFNLSAGKNYKKWKIQFPDQKPEYYSPDEVQLVLGKCTVKNYKKIAQKIFEGADKEVCAWILCEEVKINPPGTIKVDAFTQLKYNPRVTPYWMWEDEVADDWSFNRIVSDGNKLFPIVIWE